MIGNSSITVLRRTVIIDRYGDATYDDTVPPTRVVIDNCVVSPAKTGTGDITGPGRLGVISGLSVLAPISADIIASDRVEIDDVVWDIDGEIGRWRSPFARLDGVEFALRRSVG